MKRKTQTSTSINDKIIYHAETPMGWSIVIMPDNILIDNYYIQSTHINSDSKKHFAKELIKEQNLENVFNIVLKHIETNQKINLEKLKKELKK